MTRPARRDAEAALDSIATGCGIPALYNDELYRTAVATPLGVRPEDLPMLAFGGLHRVDACAGCSNVGSLDAGLNLPLILSATLQRSLATAKSFEELWTRLSLTLP